MRFFIFAVVASCALAIAASASAAKTSVATSPNPIAVGESFTITLCGSSGKVVTVSEYAPDGSLVTSWNVLNSAPTCVDLQAPATTQTGTYLITVGSVRNPDSGNESATETVF